jgi:hypothetical protein
MRDAGALPRQGRRSPVFARRNAPETHVAISTVLIDPDSSDLCRMLKDRSSPPPSRDRCRPGSEVVPDTIRSQGEPDRRDSGRFHRDKFLWLEQVHADPELTPLAFRLAYVLANLVNDREGFAWPSIAHLAAKCRATENGVKKVIRRLTERGHLFVEFETGRGRTNRYRWIVKGDGARTVATEQHDSHETSRRQKEQRAWSATIRKGATDDAPSEEKRGNAGNEKGQQAFRKGVTPVAPTLIKESIYDLSYRLSAQRNAKITSSAFDEFWRAYPKKVGLTDAIGAFARATERAPPIYIIRGAMRYAAERDGENPRYTKNPATWLNKACWNDPSAASALSRPGPQSMLPFNRSALGRLHDDADVDEVLERIRQQTTRRE